MAKREHTISGLVKNKAGILFEIAKTFKDEGINIKSIAAGETEDPALSRVIIVVDAEDRTIEEAEEKLKKMPDVKKVDDLTAGEFVAKELVMIKVGTTKEEALKIMQIAEIFRAEVIGVGEKTMTLEMTGEEEKVKGFIKMLKPFGIRSMARTGKIALKVGDEI